MNEQNSVVFGFGKDRVGSAGRGGRGWKGGGGRGWKGGGGGGGGGQTGYLCLVLPHYLGIPGDCVL
jgi:hypothetical protein